MKEPASFKQIKKRFTTREIMRRENGRFSNEALNKSKRAIFALHRGDQKAAIALLAEAKALFEKCEKKFKSFPNLACEGSYLAGLEEYAEALLYFEYKKTGKISGKLEARVMAPATFIAGLCDTTGEIVRDAVRAATEGADEKISYAHKEVETVISFLLDLDLTGPLRNKFDQAKRNLRNLEQMLYDVSLRR